MSAGRDSVGPELLVLVPAFDEAPRLPALLAALRRELPDAPVVVVDDGSRDDTAAVARAGGATVLRHGSNLGYGAALQTGYKHAARVGAQVVVQLDADGQHDPACVKALLAVLEEQRADVVIGSRFASESGYRMGWARSFGRRLFMVVARAAGLRVTDPTSGLQALRRSAFTFFTRDFFPTDYPDVDVLLLAHRRGLRIVEHPVRMHAATRASLLHGGLRSFYYLYRLGLALWAGTSRRE